MSRTKRESVMFSNAGPGVTLGVYKDGRGKYQFYFSELKLFETEEDAIGYFNFRRISACREFEERTSK